MREKGIENGKRKGENGKVKGENWTKTITMTMMVNAPAVRLIALSAG